MDSSIILSMEIKSSKVSQLRAGDKVILGNGITVLLTATPHWSDYHGRWYVQGYRLIKSKGAFSSVGRQIPACKGDEL